MKNKKRHIENLNEIEKTRGFKVPEGYFDQFQQEVLSKIDEEVESKSTSRTIQFRTFYSVAASIALLLVAIFIVWYFTNQNSGRESGYDELISQLSDEEIMAYLEYSDIGYTEIAPYLDENALVNEAEDPSEFFDLKKDEADALLEYYSL